MVRILHFADLHLDRPYAGLGMASSEANKRRWELRDALRRIVNVAIERQCDLLTVGGDLYEHDYVRPDTANFLAEQFKRFPGRVLVAPGNHDPYKPESVYRQQEWSPNVHIFRNLGWQAVTAGEVTIYGVGHTGPAIYDNLLRELKVTSDSTSIALFHGSDMQAVPEGKQTHAPFYREDVENCGAQLILLGHYHGMRLRPDQNPRFGYPGSPEPLDFGEAGIHYVIEVLAEQGSVEVAALPINDVNYRTEWLDVSTALSSDDVREAIVRLAGEDGHTDDIVRVVLQGQVEPDVEINVPSLLTVTADGFRYLDVVNQTLPAFDLQTLREETTTRGLFVRKILERIDGAPMPERTRLENALNYGLQAFDGRTVLPR